MVHRMSDTPPGWSLQDALNASGARPNSRMSDLSRYMLDHYDEVHSLIAVRRYSWADVTRMLAEQAGFTDATGKPISVDVAKLTWSRINRRKRTSTSPKPVPPSPTPFAAAEPQPAPSAPTEYSSQNRDEPFAEDASPRTVIRPARPRDAAPTVEPAKDQANTTRSLLSEEEVERRLADLAARQGGLKILPPEVL